MAVSLFGFSLAEIRGHERVMERMVQEQADLLALSVAGVIDAHIDQRQTVLWRVANEEVQSNDLHELAIGLFDAGMAKYEENTKPTDGVTDYAWQTAPQVLGLVEQVRESGLAASTVLEAASSGEWLFIQVEPTDLVDRDTQGAIVYVGASSVTALTPDDLYDSVGSGMTTGLTVVGAFGEPLLSTGTIIDDNETVGKIAVSQIVVPLTGWQVVVRQDWEKLVPPLLRFANSSFVIAAIAVLVSLLSAYFGLRNIVRPLRRLDAATSEIAWGNFEAIREPVGGVAEIEELRTALVRMTDQIQLYQKDLQSYIGAMTVGQEEERMRLARELHDETIQDLIALSQQVEFVEREVGHDSNRATERLGEVRPLLTGVIDGLRRQIHDLRPLYLEDLGFVPALDMLVRQVSERHNLVGDFHVSGQAEYRLVSAVEVSAFRIVQEALNNVAAHADASWVHVELAFEHDGIEIRVEDDGCGFVVPIQPYELAQQGQFGLLGMKERAQLHGGKLQIESTPDSGTTVLAWLPNTASGVHSEKA